MCYNASLKFSKAEGENDNESDQSVWKDGEQ